VVIQLGSHALAVEDIVVVVGTFFVEEPVSDPYSSFVSVGFVISWAS